MGDITANFSRSEFACKGIHCCEHSSPINEGLVTLLQLVRNTVGGPLHVNSGYRCNKHNRQTTGASSTSQHCLGKAADIQCPKGWKYRDFYNLCSEVFEAGGVGAYTENFVHVDVRGNRARWAYYKGKPSTLEKVLEFYD